MVRGFVNVKELVCCEVVLVAVAGFCVLFRCVCPPFVLSVCMADRTLFGI